MVVVDQVNLSLLSFNADNEKKTQIVFKNC